MKIKHYKKYESISMENSIQIQNMMDSCELIYGNEYLKDIVNERAGKTISVIYNNLNDACGFCMMSRDYDYILDIDVLYVSPTDRGKGYATALLNYAKVFAKQEKCYETNLIVSVRNENARKVYEKNEYVYDKKSKGSSVVTMIQYSNRLNYIIGGIIYNLAKIDGIENLDKTLNNILRKENFEIFYPLIKVENKNEIIKKVINSKAFEISKNFAIEISKNDEDLSIARTFLYRLDRNFVLPQDIKNNFPISTSLEKNELMFACVSINATASLYKQEKFLSMRIDKKP